MNRRRQRIAHKRLRKKITLRKTVPSRSTTSSISNSPRVLTALSPSSSELNSVDGSPDADLKMEIDQMMSGKPLDGIPEKPYVDENEGISSRVASLRKKKTTDIASILIAYDHLSGEPIPKDYIGLVRRAGEEELQLVKVVKRRINMRTMDGYDYYVHYKKFDRRMDEWISRCRFVFRPMAEIKKRLEEFVKIRKEEEHKDSHEHHNAHIATRVKNVIKIMIGGCFIDTWYFSPFPVESWREDRAKPRGKSPRGILYFCDYCLEFFPNNDSLEYHLRSCELYHPPGNEIYRGVNKDGKTLSIFEVDGYREKQWCQNLSYIAKLFLDHKTLHYDVEPFLFYILTEVDERGCQFVSYFSKEKWSELHNNLACILTLPNHQRKGYGSFLMRFSYELSKLEKTWGSPEKPLSDLGKLGYVKLWSSILMDLLINSLKEGRKSVSLKEIQSSTSFSFPDITDTLKEMKILEYYMGNWTLKLTQKMIDNHLARKRRSAARSIKVHPERILFVPYEGQLWKKTHALR